MEEMKKEFRPEFLNRIDKIIVFKPLGFEELKKITQLQISYFAKPPAGTKCPAKSFPCRDQNSFPKKVLTRPRARALCAKTSKTFLEDPLAEKIISGRTMDGAKISADIKGDKITFSVHKGEKLAVAAM